MKAEFHTYQSKFERKFEVILRNIHPTVDVDEISNELETYNHQVCSIYNIKHHRKSLTAALLCRVGTTPFTIKDMKPTRHFKRKSSPDLDPGQRSLHQLPW